MFIDSITRSYDYLKTHNPLVSNQRDNKTNIFYNSILQIELLSNDTTFS